ncbi:hypothetical protein [Pelosinus sp. UFO1]|uniref:hypothetical protein n=1 Tax=Pelosinus sp. UFO1 TaxID=484770 RepID=UPI0004D0C3D5|nr:hypothetical protein [Pelosinus sp. UFO1]AIF50735.1 hypothetical protein UFO1_1180 [Pelosinus sp. UFO1]
MQTLLNVLILSVTEIFYLFGILIAVGLLLGWIESLSNGWAYKAFGKSGIMLTACIGTPIHEIGHALMCLLFGHKIISIKLFDINPNNSTLGYVNHSFNKYSLYQRSGNFFISIGPIFSGTAAILFFMYMLEPNTFKALQMYIVSAPVGSNNIVDFIKWSGHSIMIVYKGIVSNGSISSPSFWLFLVLTICTSSHIALSRADIDNAKSGLIVTLLVVVLFNIGASLYGIETLKYVLAVAKYNIYLLSVLSVSIAFSLVTALIMGIFCSIKGYHRN